MLTQTLRRSRQVSCQSAANNTKRQQVNKGQRNQKETRQKEKNEDKLNHLFNFSPSLAVNIPSAYSAPYFLAQLARLR